MTAAVKSAAFRRFWPNRILAAAGPAGTADDPEIVQGKTARDGRPTLYICRGTACLASVNDLDQAKRLIESCAEG